MGIPPACSMSNELGPGRGRGGEGDEGEERGREEEWRGGGGVKTGEGGDRNGMETGRWEGLEKDGEEGW